MHRLPKIFSHSSDRRKSDADSASVSGDSCSSSRRAAKSKPRFERHNARKNISYDYSPSSASAPSSSSSSYYTASEESVRTRSLDLYGGRQSFRVEGIDGEIEIMCKNIGFAGIDDFSISPEEYAVMKVRSSSAPVGFSQGIEKVGDGDFEVGGGDVEEVIGLLNPGTVDSENLVRCENSDGIRDCRSRANVFGSAMVDSVRLSGDILNDNLSAISNEFRGSGIKGVRPPFLGLLAPPPFMSLPVIDQECSTWDIFRKFGPDSERLQALDDEGGRNRIEDEDQEDERRRRMEREEKCLLSASCSFTTSSNDDDCSSTTTDPLSSVSPNGRFRRVISTWRKGDLLGSGSFGSVYEGIAE